MLHAAKDLVGIRLEARDGPIGRIEDLYFEDDTWTCRYVVVNPGSWLLGRPVLLNPRSLGAPHRERKSIPAFLTREQVRRAPGWESDKPVSRQFERLLLDHYGLPYYWTGPGAWAIAGFADAPAPGYPAAAAVPPAPDAREQGEAEPARVHQGDPHLRSMSEVRGYHVAALDGDIGHIEDFLVDDADWRVRFLAVDTRNWLPGRHVAVPADWAKAIRWDDRHVDFRHTREEIRMAPEYSGLGFVSEDYARTLAAYWEESPQGP